LGVTPTQSQNTKLETQREYESYGIAENILRIEKFLQPSAEEHFGVTEKTVHTISTILFPVHAQRWQQLITNPKQRAAPMLAHNISGRPVLVGPGSYHV